MIARTFTIIKMQAVTIACVEGIVTNSILMIPRIVNALEG